MSAPISATTFEDWAKEFRKSRRLPDGSYLLMAGWESYALAAWNAGYVAAASYLLKAVAAEVRRLEKELAGHCGSCWPEMRWTSLAGGWYLWKGGWAKDGWLRNRLRASVDKLQGLAGPSGSDAAPLPPALQQPRTPDLPLAPARGPAVPRVSNPSQGVPKPLGPRGHAQPNSKQARSGISRIGKQARWFNSNGLDGLVKRLQEDIKALDQVRGYLMHANEHPENLDHPMLDLVEQAQATLYWLTDYRVICKP